MIPEEKKEAAFPWGAIQLAQLKSTLKSAFFRNFLVLMSGTALAQVISVAIAPFLTRLYDPADFGVFGVYISIVGIIGAVPTLRYEQAMMLPKSNEEAANLFGDSLASVAIVATVAALVCIPFGGRIAAMTDSPGLSHWLWLVPISVFLSGATRRSIHGQRVRNSSIGRRSLLSFAARRKRVCRLPPASPGPARWGSSAERSSATPALARLWAAKCSRTT